ncbi:MAG: type II methionyl aminopeptidase [Desulfurococcales archaeon]|nr:type II methionyl aminopeptidase [Desulfurococcales archaeon]
MLDGDIVEKYRRAGDIAKRVREEAVRIAKPGMKLLELAEYIEKKIFELGGAPAFPVNLSINDVAAHYTPTLNDEMVIPDGAVLKIDIGVHVDGYIADTAATVTFNPAYESLLEASYRALDKVIEKIGFGVKAYEIGRLIEETILSYGFKPIKNLAGHSMDRYIIHSGYSIPNYFDRSARWSFSDGAYAIEPFATNGIGLVREEDVATIFSLRSSGRRTRLSYVEKRVVEELWRERRTLPFCERWLRGLCKGVESIRNTIQLLIRKGLLYLYPVLVERGHGYVAQFEHTFLINGREVIVTTA